MNTKKYLLIMTAVIMLLVPSCTMTPNHPPIITSLEAEAETVFPSGSCQIVCIASDPDGDELSYEWSTSGGDIYVTGPEVTWTAPEEVGIYSITVVVDDGYGDSVSGTLSIKVMPNQPLDIVGLEITKERWDHCWLRIDDTRGIRVGQGKKFDIECLVSDMVPGTNIERFYQLFYEWACDDGKICEVSEDGSMITWESPNKYAEVTVTVTVSDIAGNMVSKSLDLQVVACSVCVFGRC